MYVTNVSATKLSETTRSRAQHTHLRYLYGELLFDFGGMQCDLCLVRTSTHIQSEALDPTILAHAERQRLLMLLFRTFLGAVRCALLTVLLRQCVCFVLRRLFCTSLTARQQEDRALAQDRVKDNVRGVELNRVRLHKSYTRQTMKTARLLMGQRSVNKSLQQRML